MLQLSSGKALKSRLRNHLCPDYSLTTYVRIHLVDVSLWVFVGTGHAWEIFLCCLSGTGVCPRVFLQSMWPSQIAHKWTAVVLYSTVCDQLSTCLWTSWTHLIEISTPTKSKWNLAYKTNRPTYTWYLGCIIDSDWEFTENWDECMCITCKCTFKEFNSSSKNFHVKKQTNSTLIFTIWNLQY